MGPVDVLGGATTSDWIDFVLTAVIGGTAFLCLFEGTRRIAAHGAHGRAVFLAALGAAFYLIYGGFAYWQYLEFRSAPAPAEPVAAAPPPAAPAKSAAAPRAPSPERAEAANLARARRAYIEKGVLEQYVDRKDEKKLFAPAQSDLQRREHVIEAALQRAVAARVSLYEILFWLATACVALVFGIGFSRDKSGRA